MFVSDKVVSLFQIAKDTVDTLRQDLATVRAERDSLKQQLLVAQTNFDWLRVRMNQVEFENKALMERAYGIKVPVPEITRVLPQIPADPAYDAKSFSLDDMGDEMARKMGFPVYSDKQ